MTTPRTSARPFDEGWESLNPVRRRSRWLAAAGLVLGLLTAPAARAQLISTYATAGLSGTYTPLVGGTVDAALATDEAMTARIPLGFTFRFDGVDYHEVRASSNGFVTFNISGQQNYSNNFETNDYGIRPMVAALWDDLGGDPALGSQASYQTSGVAGSRVFTFEWKNWQWQFDATSPTLSFQVKLYEGSNRVELVYGPTLSLPTTNKSASIGLLAQGGEGDYSFMCVNDSQVNPTICPTISCEMNSIDTPPADGQIYRFTPAASCSMPATYATLPVSQSFETAWTDACSTGNAAGASWRTTPIFGDMSWRRDDDGASASWYNPTSYLPSPIASQGAHAAVFHSAYAPQDSTGSLDLYANLSVGGTKTLTFDYVNTTTDPGENEHLDVLLSTDGGVTFGAPLLTLTTAATFATHSLTIPSTSATSVIRFRGTSDFGNSDIAIDNVQLVAASCAPPTSASVTNITSTTASLTFTNSGSATNYTVTYMPAGGSTLTVSPSPMGTPVSLTSLTPATVYTVSAVSNCSGGTTSSATPTLTFTTAPANDLCVNAQLLTPVTPCGSTTGTVGGASGGSPTSALGTPDDDVWYYFTASSTQHHITVTPTGGADLVHELFAPGGCPASGAVALYSSDNDDMFATGLTVGATYRVRVYSYYAVPLTPTAGGFTICVDHPSNAPANDECAGAIGLGLITSTCTTTSGTLFGATQSTVSGTDVGTADDDIWYSFVATNSHAGIYLVSTGGLDLVLNLRTAPCASSTNIRFGDQGGTVVGSQDSITARHLVVGQTYYVRVYSYHSTVSTASNGTFTLCVSNPGTCAPPTNLHSGNITNTTADMDWTTGASGVSYQMEYGLAGFTPGTGTVVSTTNTGVLVTGLTPGTTYEFYVTQICASGISSVRVGPQSVTTTGTTSLIVSSVMNVPTGTYDNVTVTSTGVATLTGTLTVNQDMTVEQGGVLVTNCQQIVGTGNFSTEDGAELRICDPAGIYATGNNGAIRVTGTRFFDPDGLYTYNGSVAQNTGPGLPTILRQLTVNNPAGVTLTNAGITMHRVLRLTSGVLNTAGLPVFLLSSINGTALVDNTGGTVNGTVQVQRYVATDFNGGMGYRHFSSPVQSATVSQLGTTSSPIVVNSAYNAATPTNKPNVTPYPAVFRYNESMVPVGGSTLMDFDEGWQSPTTTNEVMLPGHGYTVQVGGGQTATFTGSLNSGAQTFSSLTYGSAGTQAGWHLLGNPYPSPLDWSTMTIGTSASNNLQNVGGAVYVFQSTGPYAGTYRSYQNGIGDPTIASGQGFFVRTAGVGQTGTVRMNNSNRVTTWTPTNSMLYRGTADLRPLLRLSVAGATSIAPDETTVYFETGATAGPDARYDAYKLRNLGNSASLFSSLDSEELSINGLAPLTTLDVVVPMGLAVPQAGQYTLHAADLQNFGATTVYLRDALTGAIINLSQQPSYSFSVAANGLSTITRFSVLFRPGMVTATRSGLDATQVALFPNPAHHDFTLLIPSLPTTKMVSAQLINTLGQLVLTRSLPVGSTGIEARFDVSGLAAGVYSLRLQAGAQAPLTKWLVIE
jgi:hypothetical protein